MRVDRRTNARRPSQHLLPMGISLLALLPMPVVPAPREKGGSLPWRPVLFGLGAVVGFAVALGRVRTVQAPGPEGTEAAFSTATSSGREEGPAGIARAIHLPAPLKDSIDAALTPDGPVLFSPPEAIDPVGAEALDAGDVDGGAGDHAARGEA